MTSLGSRPARAARHVAALAVVSLSVPSAARATSCGDTLGSGHHVLGADLTCDASSGSGVGLELTTGAHLDMDGHSITFVTGGTGTGLRIVGTNVHVTRGIVHGASVGIRIEGGGNHHLRSMTVFQNNFGLVVTGSSGNDVADSDFSANFDVGVSLDGSSANHFQKVVVDDTFGTALQGGFALRNSDDNVIAACEVSRNACTGIELRDSSRNSLRNNVVDDTRCPFATEPAVGIALLGDSDDNVLAGNETSSTTGTPAWDGINVGCKGGCSFQGPTTGANGNEIEANTADHNARYGVAQASGNVGNTYLRNDASGNGVADVAIDP
jgi:parallel beta-helix repeat protein